MMENGEESTEGMTEVENKSLDVAEDVKTDEEELPDVVMNAKAPVNNEEKWMLQMNRKSLADQPPTLSEEHAAPHPTPVVEEYVTADEDEEKEANKAQTPQKFVNKKINKLQNMGKTESVESFVSVESEIEVSMKDYYKIRMENRMASVSDCQREEEESKVFDSVANPVSGITVK